MRSASRLLQASVVIAALCVSAWVLTTPAEVHVDDLMRRVSDGWITHEGALFTGVAIDTYPDGSLAERTEYTEGRPNGRSERWYEEGPLSYRATYTSGRRHGVVETWWSDGTTRSQSHYEDGVPHGVQRQWYRSGALFKEQHLDHGHEVGLQRAWRENGTLYANYEVRNGRNYGLKRAELCFEVEDGVAVASLASSGDDDPGATEEAR